MDDYSGKSESEHSDIDNFSDHDDGADMEPIHDDDDDNDNDNDDRDCFEPQVDIVENSEDVESAVKTEPITDQDLDQQDADVLEDDVSVAIALDKASDIENYEEEDSDSVHSEYLPTRAKPAKGKGKRGRPRKNKQNNSSSKPAERENKRERRTREKAMRRAAASAAALITEPNEDLEIKQEVIIFIFRLLLAFKAKEALVKKFDHGFSLDLCFEVSSDRKNFFFDVCVYMCHTFSNIYR